MSFNQQSNDSSIELQTATAVIALAAAICKQPGIDSQQLREDFLDILGGITPPAEGIGLVGQRVASAMGVSLQAYDEASEN
ncbi:hypothetical protein GCM10010975_20110 [Comamonas phosphati]|nr:hypothetical protein GCM10010975_20110 [Comamonas phosphati]